MDKNEKNQNRLSGRYDIIEQIGIGGMSIVYKAYDTKKKKIVAIKMLKDELSNDDEFVSKFKAEALASKDIKHKNVISAYDVVDEENMHFIVMEYVDGTTLNKYIKEKGKLTNEETVNISLQVAKGIKAAHEKGIIHRDIKPQNIVINSDNVVKITDFGIARAITSTTRNISVVGTVHYISPEQVKNETVDFRSDIYSFGCTMYEMITGVVPFEGEKPIEIIISHLRESIKAPHLSNQDVYDSVEKIILKATRMLPRERYQCIEDMIADLEKAIANPNGAYIKDSDYEDDEEGRTVIFSDDDMKVIRAVSEKYSNHNSYKKADSNDLTPEQKEFFDRYIKNGAYKQHLFLRKLLIFGIIAIIGFAAIILIITLDTKKTNNKTVLVATKNIVETVIPSLDGMDWALAQELAVEYNLLLNLVGEEYSDKVAEGKILRVVNDNLNVNKSADVVVSKGSKDIDFTDIEKLQTTRWTDMMIKLNERGLKYDISEINDINVPRGYIIGVNKKNSKELGELIFTISRGISDQIKTMPDLQKKTITEAKELLAKNELVLGNISFLRDIYIPENSVIKQSIEPNSEVKAGTSIDLTLSCGIDGVEYIASVKPKWHSELSATYRVVNGNSPTVAVSDKTMILQIRLRQQTSEGTVYTELVEPQEYRIGTIIPLVFTNLEGEEKVQDGYVEVVDVVNDVVVSSTKVMFWPIIKKQNIE